MLRKMRGRQDRRKTGGRRQKRGGWKRLSDEAVKKSCGQHLTTDNGKRGIERENRRH